VSSLLADTSAAESLVERLLKVAPTFEADAASADTPNSLWADSPQEEGKEDDGLAPPKAPGELGWLGPYRVIKVLGEGGMGKVYLAEDPALQRSVALKVMKLRLARDLNAR